MIVDEEEQFNCVLCGRFLAKKNANGTFNLAGQAEMSARMTLKEGVLLVERIEDAVCNKLICRIRRWWKGSPQ